MSNNDLKLLPIFSNMYNEFVINLMLSSKLKRPDKITKTSSFKYKLILLDALGFLKSEDQLYKNLILLKKIRNIYAHQIIGEINFEQVEKRIGTLWSQFKNNHPKNKEYTDYEKYKLIETEILNELFHLYLESRPDNHY